MNVESPEYLRDPEGRLWEVVNREKIENLGRGQNIEYVTMRDCITEEQCRFTPKQIAFFDRVHGRSKPRHKRILTTCSKCNQRFWVEPEEATSNYVCLRCREDSAH